MADTWDEIIGQAKGILGDVGDVLGQGKSILDELFGSDDKATVQTPEKTEAAISQGSMSVVWIIGGIVLLALLAGRR